MAEVKVLPELQIGEKYSGRDIDLFITSHDDVVVISESCMECADLQTDTQFEIKAKFNGYNHSGYPEKFRKRIPLSRIYIIS